jgi:hypothetical protein
METDVRTSHLTRTAIFGVAATLAVALSAPIAAQSWDEASGYGALEANRAAIEIVASAPDAAVGGQDQAAGSSWDETSGYGALEAGRGATAVYASSSAGNEPA